MLYTLQIPTLLLVVFDVGNPGQQLDGVLGPDPDSPVKLQLQDVVVVQPGGLYHLHHVSDKLLTFHKLDTSIDLEIEEMCMVLSNACNIPSSQYRDPE